MVPGSRACCILVKKTVSGSLYIAKAQESDLRRKKESKRQKGEVTHHDPLHFIVDNAFEQQRGLWIRGVLVLQAPTFLPEVQIPQVWEEHGVEVDGEKVREILPVLSRKGIHGPVMSCEEDERRRS